MEGFNNTSHIKKESIAPHPPVHETWTAVHTNYSTIHVSLKLWSHCMAELAFCHTEWEKTPQSRAVLVWGIPLCVIWGQLNNFTPTDALLKPPLL